MKRVRTQAEVCEYYWKPVDQRTFVSRMVKKGLVVKEQWGYTIKDEVWADSVTTVTSVTKESVTKCNNDELERLREENEKLKQENKELFLETLWSSESSDNELQANYEYLQQKFRRLKRGYELVIQLTYKYAAKNMKITKEEYKEQLSEEVNEILNEEMWRLE